MQTELNAEARIRLLIAIINDEGSSKLNASIKKILTRLTEYKQTNEKNIVDYFTKSIKYIPLKSPIYSKILQLFKDNGITNKIFKQLTSDLKNENEPFIHLNALTFFIEGVSNKLISESNFSKFIDESSDQPNLLYLIILAIVLVYDGSKQKGFLVDAVEKIKALLKNFSEYTSIVELISKELSEVDKDNNLLLLNIEYVEEEQSDEKEEEVKMKVDIENPFNEISQNELYSTMTFPIKDDKISGGELFEINSYEKLQKMVLLSEIIYLLKDNFQICQKYISNIHSFYGFEKDKKNIKLLSLLPEVILRLIINHKKESNIITLISSLTVHLIKTNSSSDLENSFTNFLTDFISKTNFLEVLNIYQVEFFLNFISIYTTNLVHSKSKILNINLSSKKEDLTCFFYTKCLVEKLSNLITKENFEQITNKIYSSVLEDIKTEPVTPKALSSDYDILSENIKKKVKFSEFKSNLSTLEGTDLLYNFMTAILINRSKTLSHLMESINLYSDDLLELKNKNPDEYEMYIIKSIFDVFGQSSVHIIFLIQMFLNKYLISHMNVLKFIFVEKFNQNKKNLYNWIFYDIIELIMNNSRFLVGKVTEELKLEQENLAQSDEDKRQEIIKRIESLESIQEKINFESQNICTEILKKFDDLIESQRLGGEEVKLFLIQTTSGFLDLCVNKQLITVEIWRNEREKLSGKN